ncbi:uncharacterized protein PADG_11618 [Paracoccidioides brasiliensis Pb18]|uniref:Protein kinase domain-containing protein n=1 Tax=Paracoccidioides brasiliensis (strain Pb18) TaxID=502780 RepID=A0A0A0HUQ7_PARBD|nr:uncharacterized protein PADG_11618 [Paracoccidioides brasiliensis Pb18]KGM92088.1 hypothetical protein PADG_11618 [Paracoccidioides brasiliensis Pb18]
MRHFERFYDVVEPVEELEAIIRNTSAKYSTRDASRNTKELAMLLKLSVPGLDHHPGKEYVIELQNHFEHDGPYGTHLCLVFPAMISDGELMTATGKLHQATYVRAISKQLLLGLDFLHN